MWTWITDYRQGKARLSRATAETHLARLRTCIAAVRTDLADLQDEVALILEDLDGVTRQVTRVQRVLTPRVATPDRPGLLDEAGPAPLLPASFSAEHRQRP
jgi:hypothetical protein